MTRARALVAIACAALLTACGSGDRASERGEPVGPGQPLELSGTSWVLTEVSVEGELRPAVDATASIGFEAGGALGGRTGCNNFFGTWVADGSRLDLKPDGMTLAACSDEERQAQETALMAGLRATATYGVRDQTLTLVDADGLTTATYRATSTDLAGTSWQATGVNNGSGAVVTSALTEQLTLAFDDDRVFGFGGCTEFDGIYTAASPAITISGPGPTTDCDPAAEEAAPQEEYLAALAAATTYRVDGNRLELRDDGGALQAGFTAAD